jgi:hypothetical protein
VSYDRQTRWLKKRKSLVASIVSIESEGSATGPAQHARGVGSDPRLPKQPVQWNREPEGAKINELLGIAQRFRKPAV